MKNLLLDTLYLMLFCTKDNKNQYTRPLSNDLCEVITFGEKETIVELYDGLERVDRREVMTNLWSK